MPSLDRHWPDFLELVRSPGSTAPLFRFVASLIDEAIGSKLTTATLFEVQAGRLRRIFSRDEVVYPVGGFKPIPANKWTDTLIGRQEVYTALSIEEIAEDFFDWQLIQSLGCESIANLPVVVAGETIGALNLLHEAGYYTPDRLGRAAEIMPFVTTAYLAEVRSGGEQSSRDATYL